MQIEEKHRRIKTIDERKKRGMMDTKKDIEKKNKEPTQRKCE